MRNALFYVSLSVAESVAETELEHMPSRPIESRGSNTNDIIVD